MTTPIRLVDVSKLQEAAVNWDKALRALPYVQLREVAGLLGLNVVALQGTDAAIQERPRCG